MMRTFACLGLLLASSAYAQFEVASVKPSTPERYSESSGITTGKGRLSANEMTLKRYIMSAFAVGQNEIVGGPDWLGSDRFDIEARADRAVDDDAALMGMLRDLLAERFHLMVHRETRTMQAYVLTIAKNGPRLEKSAGGEASTSSGRGRLEARAITMDGFAQRLGRQVELPVVNRTGLEGAFNLKLEWAPDDAKPESGPSIFTAIQQLGLRLTTQKTPVEILVIDHAERPSAN
jgi:uncharacterized protein (TIGR03435 family)